MNNPSLIFGLLLGLIIGVICGGCLSEADMREQAITRKLAHWELVGNTNRTVFKWNEK